MYGTYDQAQSGKTFTGENRANNLICIFIENGSFPVRIAIYSFSSEGGVFAVLALPELHKCLLRTARKVV